MGTKKDFEAVLWGASKKGLNLEKSFFLSNVNLYIKQNNNAHMRIRKPHFSELNTTRVNTLRSLFV